MAAKITLISEKIKHAQNCVTRMINVAKLNPDYWELGVEILEITLKDLHNLITLLKNQKFDEVPGRIKEIIGADLFTFLNESRKNTDEGFPYKIYSNYWTLGDFNTLYTNILALDQINTTNSSVIMSRLPALKNHIRLLYETML